jgi:hypothetical protein
VTTASHDQTDTIPTLREKETQVTKNPTFRDTRSVDSDNNDDVSDILGWDQAFPGAELVCVSPSVDGTTMLNDESNSWPSMLPRIIEATPVANDEHEQLEKERKRLKDEE